MKQLILCLLSIILGGGIIGQTTWKPAGDKIRTPWAEKVRPENVRGEYPRPILERQKWMNLNGLWEYAVTDKGCVEPTHFDGNILVPFCIESSLSGVQRKITGQQELWYKRTFNIPADWKGKHIRLNFDAVDWQADVYVNDIHIGFVNALPVNVFFQILRLLLKSDLFDRFIDPRPSIKRDKILFDLKLVRVEHTILFLRTLVAIFRRAFGRVFFRKETF